MSGVLEVAEGQTLDGDTNDPHDPLIENDTVEGGGQVVFPPVTIGGYAHSESDEWDIYRVNLEVPTRIVLTIADHETGDLDLYLTEIDGTVVADSVGTGPMEIIETHPEQLGAHLVAVRAFHGDSNYLLAMGLDPAGAGNAIIQGGLSTGADFVPDEVVLTPRGAEVRSHSAANPEPFSVTGDLSVTRDKRVNGIALSAKAHSPAGSSLMSIFARNGSAESVGAASAQWNDDGGLFTLRYRDDAQAAKARTLAAIKTLRRTRDVEHADPNYLSQHHAVPNDEYFDLQWHYRQINVPQAWQLTAGSDDVVVAVIDSGVVYTHPDLEERMLRREDGSIVGFDFIADSARSRRGEDGVSPDPFDLGDQVDGVGSSFHGTHVSGTIAASTDNGQGVAGVTWRTKIMPLRVLGVGGATDFEVAQAILYAAGVPNVSDTVPPVRADVINLSLGPGNPSCTPLWPLGAALEQALETALAAGSVVILAAGNDSCDVPQPMSTVEGVINVSAVDRTGEPAYYSNFGPTIDVAAPGGDTRVDLVGDGWPDGVLSTWVNDRGGSFEMQYTTMQGTSMAAPHVAGVIALMLSVNPSLTPQDINRLLEGTHPDPAAGPITIDLGEAGWDPLFGHGLIDAFQAVNVALSISGGTGDAPPVDEPILSVSPEALNFGSLATSLQFIISNPSTARLEVTEITPTEPWITIDTGDFPIVTVVVDRTGLPEGSFTGGVLIRSNAGDATVPVLMRNQLAVTGGDVGTVYVVIVDPETLETVSQTVTSVREGYRYDMPPFPPGEYILAAGTDRNDDGFICDAGEACGLYPLMGSPVLLEAEGDMEGVDFAVSYHFSIGAEVEGAAAGHRRFTPLQRIR